MTTWSMQEILPSVWGQPPRKRRSWWRRILSIPGYAAGWLGDHLVNILIMVFVVLVATFMFPPL